MPANKLSFEDPRFGTVIWNYEPPSCSSSGSLRAYQQIYMGDADVRIRNDATSQNKYEGSILTVVPSDQAGVLPKTFGLALHHKTTVCHQPAYQSNIEDVVVLILQNSQDQGAPINHNIALSQPHLTSFKTVASRWFVEANNRVDDLSQTFYEETCKLERQTIMNYQRILRMATSSTSLAPYFNEGFTAIRTGGVARVIHCQAEEAEINLQQDGCWDQLPVYRLDEDGKPYNETWFADPVTKVLTPTGTRVDCSSRYPQMYRLSGGTYVCQSGSGITRCASPTVLTPGTADLHDALTNQFHKLMGTGIYTKAEQRQIDFRFHEQQYEDHLRSEQTYKNKKNIRDGLPMTPAISPESEKDIFRRFAAKFNPVFHFLGEWYGYAIGLLFVTALLAGFCGCTRRMCWEIKYVGCTPMIIMTACQGIWTVARMPYHMWRGAATAPATVAQKGTPFDFEDVPLTGNGLNEQLTRSPPPPYNPSFKERMSNRWRQWRSPSRNDPELGDPSAPESTEPSNTDIIRSPRPSYATQKYAPSDTSSSLCGLVTTQPSGFQRFIPGGSADRCSNVDTISDACPYPDVDKARASGHTHDGAHKTSIEDDQVSLPQRNLSIRQMAFFQRRYGAAGQHLTNQQLNTLVQDSTDSVNRAILAMPEDQQPLRKPVSLPATAMALSPPNASESSDTSDVPIYIKDHIDKK